MERIAIVGAGLAGLNAAQEFRRLGHDGELVMIGAEPYRPYRRPPLSKEYLVGKDVDLELPGADETAATWLLGQPATGLDLAVRRVLRGPADPVHFDHLVIATGVRARTLPEVRPMPGMITLRGLDDTRALRAALDGASRVVVAGAGFVGSEVAASLRALDVPVTLVEPDAVPLRRPLGDQVGALVADLHRAHGVDLRLGRWVKAVSGAGKVERVLLDDGTVIPADVLVVALGAQPEVEWLRDSGLLLDGGVVVGDDGLAAAGVAAAGDVTCWPHPLLGGRLIRVEHYTNAVEQGSYAARAVLGVTEPFAPVPSFWCHLYDRRLQSVGFTGTGYDVSVVSSQPDGRFLVEYRDADRVVGAVTAGHIRELPRYRAMIAAQYATPTV